MKINMKLFDESLPPERATEGSLGSDLYYPYEKDLIINPNETDLVPMGIWLDMTGTDLTAFIISRSSIPKKLGLVVKNGIGLIDNDYQEELKLLLWNTSDAKQVITKGQRIAQLVFIPEYFLKLARSIDFNLVDNFAIETQRGGFGSTGGY
jgi:dUTP pyrophosphatase